MGCIYKITNNINKKIYIGYTTTSINKRINKHKNDDIKYGTLLGRAISKYGWDNFSYEVIIEENDRDKLLQLEQYYIKLYDCCVLDGQDKGYNMTRGGEVLYGENNPFYKHHHTEETRKLFSEIASKRIGKLNSFYGKKHTDETKRKLRAANSKPIAALDENGNVVLRFNSGFEAKDYLIKNNISKDKTCNSTIIKAIKNKRKIFGYYWTYV